MTDNALKTIEADVATALEARGFKALQELSRHGYAPDPRDISESGALLIRHATGPDLLLRPDGTIELPENQPVKSAGAEPASRRTISWRRAALFLLGLVLYTLVSAVVIINLTAN